MGIRNKNYQLWVQFSTQFPPYFLYFLGDLFVADFRPCDFWR